MAFSHQEVLEHYNFIIRTIEKYYDYVDNRERLSVLLQRLTESAALTLAAKYRVRRSVIIARFGSRLKDPLSGKELRLISSTKRKRSLFFSSMKDISLEGLSAYIFKHGSNPSFIPKRHRGKMQTTIKKVL